MSSNFENLPLPVNRDAQDYSRLVPANSVVEIPVVGDFVYCKFSDGSVRVVINGKSTSMESGDERRSGGSTVFRGVTLINDSDVIKSVTFVIGFGGFDRKIIQGEITAQLKIRTVSGKFIDDTRQPYDLDLRTVVGTGLTETAGDIIAERFVDGDWSNITFSQGGVPASPRPRFNADVDFNPDVHNGVMLFCFTTSGSDYRLLEIDPVGKTVIKDWGRILDQGGPVCCTRFGNRIFLGDRAREKRKVYTINSDLTETEFCNPPGKPTKITVMGDGTVIVATDQAGTGVQYALSRYNQSGELLSTAFVDGLGSGIHALGHLGGNLWAGGSSFNPLIIDPITLETINTETYIGKNEASGTLYFNYAVYVQEKITQKVLFMAIETITDALVGKATPECENAWLGPKPTRFTGVRTSADITVIDGDKANPTVTGEVLKVIFEWFIGGKAPKDYMDYIHAVEITGSADRDGTTFPAVKIQSQGQTFAAAGIDDSFSQIFPISATITFDNRITKL